MPNTVLRVALAICTLLAVLMLSAPGIAIADPEEPSSPTEPDTTSEPPTVSEPQPVTPPAVTPVVPPNFGTLLRDLLHRPLSIFGNGRVPGQPPPPSTVNPDGSPSAKDKKRRAKVVEPAPDPEPIVEPVPVVPAKKPTSSVNVLLPFAKPISIPVPSPRVPGYEGLRLTVDLTDPHRAAASLQETANTLNSLLADAYAPYDPFKPPEPTPSATFRILGEDPVLDADGIDAVPVSDSSAGLPVLQAPVIVPPVRMAAPRPVSGTSSTRAVAGAPAAAQVLGAGTAGVRAPVLRGSVAQTGSTSAGRPAATPSASEMGRPALRQGYQQYLRSARGPQVAAVAVPGLLVLVAITASGVVTGYRQANSQRYLRVDAARFLA